MENSKIMLLFQLVSSLEDNVNSFSKSFNSQDKEKFDLSKKALLEIQKKIAYILK